MAKSRGRKFAELVAPTNGVFSAASIPTIAISKLASSAVTINSESLSLGGSLTLDTSDIGEHTSNKYFTDTRAQATLSVASNSGHGALAYDNSNGEFTFAGITTEAIQDVVGAMFSSNTETAVTVTYQDSDGTIDLIVDDTTKLPLAGGTMTGNLTLGDNVNAYFGASTDLRIYHDGTNSHIINSTGELRVTGSNIAIKSDSAKLYLGASDDLKIYHDGSNSFIEEIGTGSLKIGSSDLFLQSSDFAETMLNATPNGAVTLYYDNVAKLATASTGVAITGLATMTTGTASSKFAVGTATVHGSYDFYNNGTTYLNGAVTVDDTLSANKLVSLDGVLELDDNGTHNGIINSPASLRINIDSDNGNTGESFAVGHNQTAINANNKLFEVNDSGQVTINNAFTFPTSDGSANQILQTNGSGTVSWVTNSGGSSLWTQSGSDIYYNSGNVGIGVTPSSSYKLKVNGGIQLSAKSLIDNSAYFISGTNGFRWNNSTDAYNNVIMYDNGNMYVRGNVGIGTTSPASLLHIEGNTNSYNTSPLLYFGSTSTANAGVRDWAIGPADSAYGNFHIFRGASTGASPIGSAGTVFTIDNAGRVGLGGIGYFAPAAPLHINSSDNQKIIFSGSNDPYIRWQEGTTNKGYMQWNAAGYFELRNEEVSSYWTLGDAFALNPTTDEAFVIQRSGDALRQHIKNTNTTGTYSYLQLSTVNSSSTQNSGYLIKNAAQGTGNSLANNSLYLWNQTNEVELVPAATIGKRVTVDGSGDLTVRGAGAAASSGIVGEAYSGYFGLRQIGQSKGSEYMILSDDTHTYISATSGHNVIIRNGGNDSTNQLVIGNSSTALSWRGNTIWTAENDGGGSGLDADLLDGQEGAVYFKGYTNVSGWQNSNANFSVRGGNSGSVGLHMERLDGGFGFQLYGDSTYYGFLDAEWANWDVRKQVNSTLYIDEGSGMVRVLTSPESNIPSTYFTRGANIYGVIGGASGANLNTFFTGTPRAGFFDGWSGSNFPSGMSHVHGVQVRHNASTHYGWQLVGQYNVSGDLRMRNISNGSFTGWYKVWTDNNDGSGSGLDADLLDGMNVHNTQGTQNSANHIVRTQANGYTMLGWINTTSGDTGNTIPTRFYCNEGLLTGGSHDAYIRYVDRASMRSLMNVTAKEGYNGREQSTTDTNYWVGTMGYGSTNFDTVFDYGSGFVDSWSNPTNQPSSETSHWVGMQALHYTNGSTRYGWQMLMGAGNNSYLYVRGKWNNAGSWAKVWNAANDGAGSGLDADLLDGLNAKGVGSASGASLVLTTNTNSYLVLQNWIDIGGSGIYSSTTNGAHLYPNTQTSYATWRTVGSRGGYDGIMFDSGGDTAVMFDSSGNGGFYRQSSGRWFNYHHVGNNCTGFSTSTTSSSYTIYVGGAIYATENIVAYSDRRIKENIVPIDNALEKVNKLAGVYYNRIDDEKKTREIGFIAQDVNEVTPELVTYAEDVDQYGVKYGNTTALLVEAVKELTQQVKDLKQELEELKNG